MNYNMKQITTYINESSKVKKLKVKFASTDRPEVDLKRDPKLNRAKI